MRSNGRKVDRASHVLNVLLLAAMAVLWTWPLARHFGDAIPGSPGDNFSFLWNLWWARHALSHPAGGFFHSTYLLSPFGVDLINHPHTVLQGMISATALARLSVVEAENAFIVTSVFLNGVSAYALAWDIGRSRRLALLAAVAFGASPYIAAHLLGHFDLLAAWVIPLFALSFRRALIKGSWKAALACGLCAGIAAYTAYYYVVYLALFAAAYALAWWTDDWRAEEGVPVFSARGESPVWFTVRLMAIGALALDIFVMIWISITGGATVNAVGAEISVRGLQNPLLVMWVLLAIWAAARWKIRLPVARPSALTFWKAVQTLMIAAAVFAVVSLPLIVQAFRLAVSGRYVSQTYYWRSAPRGVDVTTLFAGNPFHPLIGGLVTRLYGAFGLDRVEQVAWLGVAPLVVLAVGRRQWLDAGEARRWKVVLGVFLVWALGPFLMVAGRDLGLPLPEILARFVPLVENARVPGRAMVGVYLALGVLMALRLSAYNAARQPFVAWACTALLACDFLSAPVPLTRLDRPALYEQLANVDDDAPVIEVPFGIGDGLSTGIGSQDRRILYYATIHQHPLVGGYIGRLPPGVAQAYQSMPIVGNLLRLSNGQPAADEAEAAAVPFRYLVLDTTTASPDLVAYVRAKLDMDLLMTVDGKELYAVQGPKPASVRASR